METVENVIQFPSEPRAKPKAVTPRERDRDTYVSAVLDRLGEAMAAEFWPYHFANASIIVRERYEFGDCAPLTPTQRSQIVNRIADVVAQCIAKIEDPASRASLLHVANCLGTLVLNWAGDPRWPRSSTGCAIAHQIVLAHELEVSSRFVLRRLAAYIESINKPAPPASEA